MEKICVIGLGSTGQAAVEAFQQADQAVFCVGVRSGQIEAPHSGEVTIDVPSKRALEEADFKECEQAIVCLEDDFPLAQEWTLALQKQDGVTCRVTVFARNKIRSRLLQKIGADQAPVVNLLDSIRATAVMILFPFLRSFQYIDDSHGVGELEVPKDVRFDIHSIEAEYSVRWIGLRRSGEAIGDMLQVREGDAPNGSISASSGDSVLFFGCPEVMSSLKVEYF